MTDSNRELILESLKGTVESITEKNGFDNEVTRVYRRMISYDDPKISFPLLMVLGGGETYEDQLGIKTVSRLRVKIRGYSKDESDPEEALNSLIRDVQIVLESSVYNSYSKSYRPISLDTDEGWMNLELNGLAMFELIIEIIYRFDRSSP